MRDRLKRLAQAIALRRGSACLLVSGGRSLSGSFGIDPSEFLQQAQDDLEVGDNSAKLNAITNAKRAIQSQIDQVLLCFGFLPKTLNTKTKFKLIAELGFVAPRMLRRVTDARNLLEHEYERPTQGQVEEAVDLTSLFVEASQRHVFIFEGDFFIGNKEDQVDALDFSKELNVSYETEKKQFRVRGMVDVHGLLERGRCVGNVTVGPGDPFFSDLVRLGVAGSRPQKAKRALARFFSHLDVP
jgi:hypothetical protein